MYAVIKQGERGMGPGSSRLVVENPARSESKCEGGDSPTGRREFIGAMGLSPVRELAAALGLVDPGDSGLWEAV